MKLKKRNNNKNNLNGYINMGIKTFAHFIYRMTNESRF